MLPTCLVCTPQALFNLGVMAVAGDGGVRRAAGAEAGGDLDLATLFFEASANVSHGRRFLGVPSLAGHGATNGTTVHRKGNWFAVSDQDAAAWLPAFAARWWVTIVKWLEPRPPGAALSAVSRAASTPTALGEWVVAISRPLALELGVVLALTAAFVLVWRRVLAHA